MGGVLLDIDYLKTEKAFVDAGIKNFSHLYSQSDASPLFEHLETGKIDPDAFCAELRKTAKVDLSNEQIINCWNAILGKFIPRAIELLPKLKEKYKLYLFSNTNAIHYNAFIKIFEEQFGRTDFDNYFHKAYYSHLIGLRKPHPESFYHIIKEEQLDPAETVFIDDTKVNIEGATKAGLQTIFLQKGKGIWELEL